MHEINTSPDRNLPHNKKGFWVIGRGTYRSCVYSHSIVAGGLLEMS